MSPRPTKDLRGHALFTAHGAPRGAPVQWRCSHGSLGGGIGGVLESGMSQIIQRIM